MNALAGKEMTYAEIDSLQTSRRGHQKQLERRSGS